MSVERPKYTSLQIDGSIELRRYESTIIAKTTVESSDMDSASNQGFRRIASFIFGGNTTQKKIAMTAPVSSSEAKSEKIAMTAPVSMQGASGNYVIAFTMPASYSIETLPLPNDPRVIVEQVPAKKMAVIGYSGTWSQDRMESKKRELEAWLFQHNITCVGEPIFARYDPPWWPWFLRTNEVQFEVE
jgi:hypothetical protein